jgi:hypothetical protein
MQGLSQFAEARMSQACDGVQVKDLAHGKLGEAILLKDAGLHIGHKAGGYADGFNE